MDKFWEKVESNWEVLVRLVQDWHPYSVDRVKKHSMPITAPGAQASCDLAIQSLKKTGDPVSKMTSYRNDVNAIGIIMLLQETWLGLPESTSVRSLPGFFALCDICEFDFDFDDEEGNSVYEDHEID